MAGNGYLLGYEISSSFIRAALVDCETGNLIASSSSPEKEMEVLSPETGWAEQHPSLWWENIKLATAILKQQAGSKLDDVKGIGISYPSSGLVLVDKNLDVLRPAILGTDNRAVGIGKHALESLGEEICFNHLRNSPGGFSASQLKWVMENEYDIYKRTFKMMFPGDYIGMRMTDEILTTPSGLSEGIMWDYAEERIAEMILKQYNISAGIIPNIVPNFYDHGVLSAKAAAELGLKPGIRVTYRAGNNCNNAFALNALTPGNLCISVDRSVAVCGFTDKSVADERSRVNTFLHINHKKDNPSFEVVFHINSGCRLYSWLKKNIVTFGSDTLTYNQMNRLAELVPAGSEGLVVLPFGDGAEPLLENKFIGATLCNLDLNIHSKAHLLRAGQEGIVFAIKHGIEIMLSLGMEINNVNAINSNLFLSPIFNEALATVLNTKISLFNTDGSQGAARGAGIGAGIYKSFDNAFVGLKPIKIIEPNSRKRETYLEAYFKWQNILKKFLVGDQNLNFE